MHVLICIMIICAYLCIHVQAISRIRSTCMKVCMYACMYDVYIHSHMDASKSCLRFKGFSTLSVCMISKHIKFGESKKTHRWR